MLKRKALMPLYLSFIVLILMFATWCTSKFVIVPDMIWILIEYAAFILPVVISVIIINLITFFGKDKALKLLSVFRPSKKKLFWFTGLVLVSLLGGSLLTIFTEKVPGDFYLLFLNFLTSEVYFIFSLKNIDISNWYSFTSLLFCSLKWIVFYLGVSVCVQLISKKAVFDE